MAGASDVGKRRAMRPMGGPSKVRGNKFPGTKAINDAERSASYRKLLEDSTIAALKACTEQKDLLKGRRLHAEILKSRLLEENIYVGSTLINMYAKCGALSKAQQVFHEIPHRDIACWNALIGGYAQHGNVEEALNWYSKMQGDGVSPDAITFVCLTKACASMGATKSGEYLHVETVREGLLSKSLLLGTALVDMYARWGMLIKAQQVFDELPSRDLVCWNVLVAGYAQHGYGNEALNCFEQMQHEGHSPDVITFASVMKACTSVGAAKKCKDLHMEILRGGLLERNIILSNALVDSYAKFGLLGDAKMLFDELPLRDVCSWTALIRGYAQHGKNIEALNFFECMQHEGIFPDVATFASVIKACGNLCAVGKGKEIHNEIIRQGLLERNAMLGTALVDMYAKCGELVKAQQLVDQLGVRDAVIWTALIAGYAQCGQEQKALTCFGQMHEEGICPDATTFIFVVNACGKMKAVEKGTEIHAEIMRGQFIKKNVLLGNALVDMYAKCGLFPKAQEVLDELPVRDVNCWNELISGYAQYGHGQETLDSIEQMQLEGVYPNAITWVFSLKACGIVGAVERGEEIHNELVQRQLVAGNGLLVTGLVDMYAKCGVLDKAQNVFDSLPEPDIACWNALIGGYALFGKSDDVFHLFDRMVGQGVDPNFITFTLILNACNHSGLVETAEAYFGLMSTCFGISSTLEHETSIIDLLGRAGHLDKAIAMIKKMPFLDHFPAWFSLLSACRKWGDVKLGRKTFQHLVQLDEKPSGAYLCMSNIYRAADMEDEAEKIDVTRVKNEAFKR